VLPATQTVPAFAPLRRFIAARPRQWPFGWSPIILVLLVLVGAVNALLVRQAIGWTLTQGSAPDWIVFDEAARRVQAGEPLFAWNNWYHYRWSPIVGAVFVVLAPLGLTVWRVGQFLAAATLPDRRLAILTLVSWPFWFDIETGNTLVFTFALAVWAIRGSYLAAIGYFALFVLIPRPLAMPVLIWLLWQRPEWRNAFLWCVVFSIIPVLVFNVADPWTTALSQASADIGHGLNLGPSLWLGAWWVPIGVVLAAYWTWRGRLGLASLAATPYILPYYLLFGLLELVPATPLGRWKPFPVYDRRLTRRVARSIE
jgi:hypothetical protein